MNYNSEPFPLKEFSFSFDSCSRDNPKLKHFTNLQKCDLTVINTQIKMFTFCINVFATDNEYTFSDCKTYLFC
jgi:hypothetical protein